MDARQNKGRPGSARLMHRVPGRRRHRVRRFERFGTHDRSVLAKRSRYGMRTPRRLMSFTSGALTTSGSDDVAAVGGNLTTAQMVVLCRLEAHEPK